MPEITSKFIQISSISDREETSNSVQRTNFAMNHLPEPISINSVDSSQDQSIDNDGYEAISDSDQNDSKDGFDDVQLKNKTRIVYSRDQLINIFKLNSSNACPDWIENNQNFPRRHEAKSDEDYEDYLQKLIEHDFEWSNWLDRSKRVPPVNYKKVENEEEISRIKSQQPQLSQQPFKSKNSTNEFESNNGNPRLTRPMFGQDNKNNYNPNNNGYNPNFRNNNMNKFGERSQMFNTNYYNQDRGRPGVINDDRNDNRNDGRGFLRSRGENLNQNFASFRRFPPNRNQHQDRNNYSNKQEEPEWFTEGPISQHDTIELKGFDEDEDKLGAGKNTQQNNSIASKQQPNSDKNQQATQQQKKKDEFDLSEFTNFDWQNVNANNNVDKDKVESIENSSRFARWFNGQQQQQQPQTSENQIERLFSNVRGSNNSTQHHMQQINTPQINQQQINQQQINQQQINQQQINQQQINQQQFNLQNDFVGNLMNRNQLPNLNTIKQQQQQQINNNLFNNNNYQNKPDTEHSLLNSPKKTDQQLFNILQKARINVDSLIEQQQQQQHDLKVIKGHVKSAEELEASLLNSQEHNVTSSINHQQQQRFGLHQPASHFNKMDLFQKLCLNANRSELINKAPTQIREENNAINPFVLNLLDDAQKLKDINSKLRLPNNNKIFNSSNSNNQDKVNPFMPTSVIRNIAAKEKNNQMNKNMGEINFETVTGNHVNERSILNRLGLNETEARVNQDNFNILNQNTIMQQNFAIATANRWNENSTLNYNVQQHRVDSTTSPEHQQDQRVLDADALKNILIKATRKQSSNSVLNNLASNQTNQLPRAQQNDNQKKLIEILQKASINNLSKTRADTGNKINNWFELELKRNNDHLSPIIKENAFTLEDIERS